MRDYIERILKELIAAKSVNYDPADYPEGGPDGMASPGEEHKVAAIVERELSHFGVRVKKFADDPKRPDLFGFIGQGEPGYRKVLLIAHMDTVPAGSNWSKPPFEASVEGDVLYGRGAEDNKGQLASLLASVERFKKIEQDIKGQVIIAAVSDEEVRMCPGLQKVIREKLVAATDAIIPDVGEEMKKVTVAEKGRLLVQVAANGKEAHASRPQLGINAIDSMAQFLAALSSHQLRHEPSDLFPTGPTINAGLIKGGEAPNQVPAHCEVTLDIRYLPTQKPQDIVAELEEIAADLDASFTFTIRDDHVPMMLSQDAPIIAAIKKHADVTLTGIGGGTVSKVLVENGIDSVGFSPGDEDAAHVADEWISLSELEEFASKIVDIASDVANQKA